MLILNTVKLCRDTVLPTNSDAVFTCQNSQLAEGIKVTNFTED